MKSNYDYKFDFLKTEVAHLMDRNRLNYSDITPCLAVSYVLEAMEAFDKMHPQGYNRAKEDDCYQFKVWMDKLIDKLDPEMSRADIVQLREQLIRERAKHEP